MSIKDNSKLINIVSFSLFFFFTISIYFLFNSISNYVEIRSIDFKIIENRKISYMARKIAMERDMVILYKHNSKYLNFLNKSVKDNNRILPKEIINRLADIRKSIKLKESISILSYYFEIEESIMDSLTDNSKKFYIDSKLNTLALILFKLYEAREFNDYERGMITVLLTKQNSRELDDKYLFEWRKYIRSANLSFSKMTLSSLKNSKSFYKLSTMG